MAKGNAIAAAVLASAGNPGSPSGGPAAAGGLSPLIASYNQSYSVNRPYSPLPRPASVFLNGAFGPFSPVTPMPIDPPREDTGRPDVRRFQYPVGINAPIGEPGTEGGFRLAPYPVLRGLANYSVARSCIDKRKQEITGLKWDVVATHEAEHAMANDDEARADWEQRRAKVVDFFSHPDSDRAKYPTFATWLGALLEDRFVIDATAVHLVPPRKKGAGLFGSDLAALDIIDGSLIKPLLNTLGATPRPPSPAWEAYAWGVPRVDLMSVISSADQEELGEPVADFRADQLIYMRETIRTNSPYGMSCIEKGLVPIKVGLARQQYQADFFDAGTVPAIFVVPGPDVSTPQQIRQLQDALNSLGQGIPEKHRVIVLPPGSKTEPQRQASLADQFDEWIISQVAMPFGLTPMDLGVTPRVSAVQSPGESRELSNINTDKGSQTRIEPVCNDLKSVIFDFVIQDLFGQQDMEWSWGLTDRGKNRAAKIQEHVTLIQNGLESIDEGRTDLGKTPWGLPETSAPLVWTGTGPVPLQAIAMDGTQPAAVPGQPAQEALPAGQAQQVSDDELTTPAHEAAQDLPGTSASSDDEDDGAAGAAKAARQAAELEYLARHLRKGRTVKAFRFDHLPPASAEAAQAARPQGVRAAVDAARQAARAQHPHPRPGTGTGGQAELRAAAARLGAAAGEAAQLARLLTADTEGPAALAKVGPHGYEHNWVFVGVPGVGDEVHHPVHGKGTVSAVTGKHVSVKFASGAEHSFEHTGGKPGNAGGFAVRGTASPHATAAREIAGDVRMEHGLTRGQREDTEMRLHSAARNLDAGNHEEAARDLDDARHAASGAGGLVIRGSVAARSRDLAAQVRAEHGPAGDIGPPGQPLTEEDRAHGNAVLAGFRPVKPGSDEEAAAYLKRNAPKVPAGQADAVNRYTGDKFFQLNKALRSGDASDPDVARIDAAMRPAPDDMVVTRHVGADAFGLQDNDLGKVQELAGKKIRDDAYSSVSLGSPYAGGLGGVTLHIAVPKGTPMVNAAALSSNPHEREILLGRGTRLAVSQVKPNSRFGYDAFATVIGHDA